MKRSSSAPSLTNTSALQKQKPICPAQIVSKRRTSSCSYSLFELPAPLADVLLETQIEAITHAPAYMVGLCMAENNLFPNQILDSSRDNNEALDSFATCVAAPPENAELAESVLCRPPRNEARIADFVIRVRRERSRKRPE